MILKKYISGTHASKILRSYAGLSLKPTVVNHSCRYRKTLQKSKRMIPHAREGADGSFSIIVDPKLRENRISGTKEGYKRQCKIDGWLTTSPTLFSKNDAVLGHLLGLDNLWPFEKHLPGYEGPYEALQEGGYITGKQAVVERGIDLRLFYDEDGQRVRGCVRFDGSKATIGTGFLLPAHGGAIETVLDEATAELGKLDAFPFLATRRIAFEIKKSVPCDTSLLVECIMLSVKGLKCNVHGKILGVDGTVYAEAEAQLVNMAAFIDKV